MKVKTSRCAISPRHRNFRIRAFTMLEILVVLAILALLTTLVVAHLGRIHERAEITVARMAVQQSLKLPLQAYRMSMGEFPSTTEGLQALLAAPAGKESRWPGSFLEEGKIPRDPWGEAFHYAYPGTHNKDRYDLWSSGPDKRSGTEDDIGNWDAAENAGVSKN